MVCRLNVMLKAGDEICGRCCVANVDAISRSICQENRIFSINSRGILGIYIEKQPLGYLNYDAAVNWGKGLKGTKLSDSGEAWRWSVHKEPRTSIARRNTSLNVLFLFFFLLFLKVKSKIHRQEIWILLKWNANVMKLVDWKECQKREISKSFHYVSYFWKSGQNYPSTRVPKVYSQPFSTFRICTLLFFQ